MDEFFITPVDSCSQQNFIESSSGCSSDEDEGSVQPKNCRSRKKPLLPAVFPQEFVNPSRKYKLEILKVGNSKLCSVSSDQISDASETSGFHTRQVNSTPSLHRSSRVEETSCSGKDELKHGVYKTARTLQSKPPFVKDFRSALSNAPDRNCSKVSGNPFPDPSPTYDESVLREQISPTLSPHNNSIEEPSSPVIGSSQRCVTRRVRRFHRDKNKPLYGCGSDISPVLKSRTPNISVSPVLNSKVIGPCRNLNFSPNKPDNFDSASDEILKSRVKQQKFSHKLRQDKSLFSESSNDRGSLSHEDSEVEEILSQSDVGVAEEPSEVYLIESPSKNSQCTPASLSKVLLLMLYFAL